MFSTLRTRLIAICVSIVVLAMLFMVSANFITTKWRTLESLNEQMLQLSQSHSVGISRGCVPRGPLYLPSFWRPTCLTRCHF